MKKKTLTILALLPLALSGCHDKVHEHSYDSEHWIQTSTHHWHESNCEHTGLAKDIAEHTFNNDGICSICGYKKEIATHGFDFKMIIVTLTMKKVIRTVMNLVCL